MIMPVFPPLLILIIALAIIYIYIYNKRTSKNWKSCLYTPTMINKINDDYFIIDCWHHRIIYNQNISDPISEWKTLTDKIKGGHTIASDGEVYLCDDTDNSLIRVFKKQESHFVEQQIIENITGRPHYILYDKCTQRFYALSSLEGKIYVLRNDSGYVQVLSSHIIDEISQAYVRSFNIIDGYMYLVSGPGHIYKVDYKNKSFQVLEAYKVPDQLHGMNFIDKIDNYFYISSYTNGNNELIPQFVRTTDLHNLISNDYEDLYNTFTFKGTPYYITHFDSKYFITEIDQSSGIKSFNSFDNHITNIETHYYFYGKSPSSKARKESKYP